MTYADLFRKLSSIVFFGYGVFLMTVSYKVEVDDYFSYQEVHSGNADLIFQPLFNFLFSAFTPIDYDYSRLLLGLIICLLLTTTIWACRSRFWYVLVLTFVWYLESLAVIHIRMGLAFALFACVYPRWRNPLWIAVLGLIHYAVLFYLLIYVFLRFSRVQAAFSICLGILVYSLSPWFESFSELDQYRVYITAIPDEYLEFAFLSILAIALLLMVSRGMPVRFLILALLAIFSKLFLGVELGGRLSSIIVLYSALVAAYPVLHRERLFGHVPKFGVHFRSRVAFRRPAHGSPRRTQIS